MCELLPGSTDEPDCRCRVAVDDALLRVDASDCPGGGDLAAQAPCRRTVVESLGGGSIERIVTSQRGLERVYIDGAAALLCAAGRFAARVSTVDQRLADRARTDPLAAAEEAVGRAGPVATMAAETGLALASEQTDDYETVLRAYVGPAVSDARIATTLPAAATLVDRWTTDTEAVVRQYEHSEGTDSYHLEPREARFDHETTARLAGAYDRLASAGAASTPYQAAGTVTDDGATAAAVGAVLAKHTEGLGVLKDLFSDPRVSDVFATAPVAETPLRVRVDGETMATNVRLSADGARALASQFRRSSGRAFSRAKPTLDATATVDGRRVRVAGVADPVSDGLAFAFRAHDSDRWRLGDFVANGTMPAAVAGLLSVAVERGGACLVAGPRGAGKTTTLGALLWELPQSVRTVLIEDTPELPVEQLQADGRDVQALRTTTSDGPAVEPAEALRTALRLGDGSLVVGEIRGEEAAVLYEAMRVGDGDDAVLGTIHGGGPEAVSERLVTDLGVPESSFAVTDLVVTLGQSDATGDRFVRRVDEVRDCEAGVTFEPLFRRTGDTTEPTGTIDRGNSRLLETLARPSESYAAIRSRIEDRSAAIPNETTSREPGHRTREQA
ncbi:type II/IV secretion system ATPase subunit [Halomicroarcula sp. GCM10025709]|uniref:type II/IV secretion system ATPase subunit n=1 Tax=Haloarcula TaxID=2237 RepID=UPI0024C2628F|nr:type II/IV secretion system ATPase subunit [Halomicroarcula sp. YJ-61-S]